MSRRLLGRIAFYLVLLVLFMTVGLKFMEDKMLYYPDGDIYERPEDLKRPFQDVWLKTSDGMKLHAWWIGDPAHRTTVLFFHGNAGNISHRIDRVRALGKVPVRFFLLDYRGYGQSEGKPSEEGLYLDARAAYDFLLKDGELKPEEIVLFGESLGGAVAVDLAVKVQVARVLLESTFTSLRELAGAIYPFIPSAMVSDSYKSVAKIPMLKAPLLQIHGTQDEIVPFEMGKRLYEAAPKPKTFFEVKEAGHNDVYDVGDEEYRATVSSFLSGDTRLVPNSSK